MWSTSQEDQASAEKTKKQMQRDWEAILELEQKYCRGEHIPGMEAMHFLKESITRVCFLMNEKDLITGTADAQVMMQCLINHVGCTSVIENTHQSAKDTLRQARHNQRSRVHKFKACIDAKILQSRQIDHVSINEMELAFASSQNLPKVLHLTHPNSHRMKSEFQHLMQAKSGSHWWPSTSAVSQFEEAMSFEFLMKHQVTPQTHQLSCLVGEPGSVLADQVDGNAFLVLAKTTSGFTAWVLEIYSEVSETNPEVEDFFFKVVVDQKSALQLRHITSLDGYLEVPVEPVLEHENGALVLKKISEPVPLPKARVQQGLDLTVKDTKAVLAAYGITLPGAPSKESLYLKLMEIFAGSEAEKAEFLARSSLQSKEDEDGASDFEDLLDLIEEDLENRNDPDVKQEKAKVKRKKMQNPKGLITLEPPTRGRGRGKGRGKGRGRGRGRGKGMGRGKEDCSEQALVAPKPKAVKKHKFGKGKSSKKKTPVSAKNSLSGPGSDVPTEEEIRATFSEPTSQILKPPSQPASQTSESSKAKGPLEPSKEPIEAPSKEPLEAVAEPLEGEKEPLEGAIELLQAFKEPVSPSSNASADFDMEAFLATPKKGEVKPEDNFEMEKPSHAEPSASAVQPISTAVSSKPSPDSLQVVAEPLPPESIPSESLVPPEPVHVDALGGGASSSNSGPAPAAAAQPEASQPLDYQAPEPGQSKASGTRGPKIYSTPAAFVKISPPGCSIRLNRFWFASLVAGGLVVVVLCASG